jgi:hypothetical protein
MTFLLGINYMKISKALLQADSYISGGGSYSKIV